MGGAKLRSFMSHYGGGGGGGTKSRSFRSHYVSVCLCLRDCDSVCLSVCLSPFFFLLGARPDITALLIGRRTPSYLFTLTWFVSFSFSFSCFVSFRLKWPLTPPPPPPAPPPPPPPPPPPSSCLAPYLLVIKRHIYYA